MSDCKETVEFREITEKTLMDILALSSTLSDEQKKMVAPNSVSIAEAYFDKDAWFRAIYAGDRPVGFMMVNRSGLTPETVDMDRMIPFNGWFLWRFMIAGPEQGKAFGWQTLDLLVALMRENGLTELHTSCGCGPGSPPGFYEKYGFVQTGRIVWNETERVLKIRERSE
jgi:diamine N-acetyltransferase